MRSSASLVKKDKERIFSLFTEHHRLKFSDIEKKINIRSNMVSYHLTELVKEKMLKKEGDFYLLTKNAESYLPLIAHIKSGELSPIPIVLVAIVKNDKILLVNRNKRPYQNYWSLLGGKMLLQESIKDSAARLVKTKTGLIGKFVSVNSILHERAFDDADVKHSFILIFVKVAVSSDVFKKSQELGELKWFDISKVSKKDTIPSDYWLINTKLKENMNIAESTMQDKDGLLTGFSVLDV